jgi:hypothetical protein
MLYESSWSAKKRKKATNREQDPVTSDLKGIFHNKARDNLEIDNVRAIFAIVKKNREVGEFIYPLIWRYALPYELPGSDSLTVCGGFPRDLKLVHGRLTGWAVSSTSIQYLR